MRTAALALILNSGGVEALTSGKNKVLWIKKTKEKTTMSFLHDLFTYLLPGFSVLQLYKKGSVGNSKLNLS